MSGNSNEKLREIKLQDAWNQEQENPQKPIFSNQNVIWYKLGGEAQRAVERSIVLNDSAIKPEKAEIKQLAETLGLTFPVERTEQYNGRCASFPEVYASPFPQEPNTFYMMCPIGGGRKDGKTDFIPADSEVLNQESEDKLSKALFSAWGGHTAFIRKEPIPLGNETAKNQQLDI